MAENDKTIVLITGANTGIGLETVRALLRSDKQYHIILAGRDIIKAQGAVSVVKEEIASKSEITPLQIDIESDESIDTAYKEVESKFNRVDCLINNAGTHGVRRTSPDQADRRLPGVSFDSTGEPADNRTLRQAFNKTWDVNITGTHILTLTFLPLLLKSSDPRLLFITSGACSLTDASTPDSPMARKAAAGLPKTMSNVAYRSSKTALNMLMLQWYNAVVNDGVKVWAVAPGFLATGLGGDTEALKARGAGEPRLGGKAIRGVVEGKRDGDVGRVVREYGDTNVIPW